MTITLVALITLALGYIAGRFHGRAKHYRLMAAKFNYLARTAPDVRPEDPIYCARDITHVFGFDSTVGGRY